MSTLVKIPAGHRVILGSRSTRRRELLELLVPADQIAVVPPQTDEEPGFGDATGWDAIEQRLEEIVREKTTDVRDTLASRNLPRDLQDVLALVCADTVIVVQEPGSGQLRVLSQPPEESWKETVTEWFDKYYTGKTHWAVTHVSVTTLSRKVYSGCVKTAVTFSDQSMHWLDAYLRTEEPLGKAGGYGLQAGGSLFVEKIEGSPSNVIGLPLRETAALLENTLPKT